MNPKPFQKLYLVSKIKNKTFTCIDGCGLYLSECIS